MPPSGPMGPPPKVKEAKEKLLLMGKSGSGKSSMRKIIFSNFVAKDVRRLGATIGYEETRVKFLGNLVLNLYDCGGQASFVDSYLLDERSAVFSTVALLIYVFDAESDTREAEAEVATYRRVLAALECTSPSARVFVLIHKMDLITPEEREDFFVRRRRLIEAASAGRFRSVTKIFPTTIWNQSLYRAWGVIVNALVPNLGVIRGYLEQLVDAVEAEEVSLFEKMTWLQVLGVRSDVGKKSPSRGREEEVSQVMKNFKDTMKTFTNSSATSHQFHDLFIKTTGFNVIIAKLTEHSFILAVFPPGEAEINCAQLNIEKAASDFLRLDGRRGTDRSDSS